MHDTSMYLLGSVFSGDQRDAFLRGIVLYIRNRQTAFPHDTLLFRVYAVFSHDVSNYQVERNLFHMYYKHIRFVVPGEKYVDDALNFSSR